VTGQNAEAYGVAGTAPRIATLGASIISEGSPEASLQRMPYEYKVVEVREKMIGGKMSGEKLEKLLNEHARQGWQLRTITTADVKGRIGPGGVEGLLITFERSV
jgi:hypothetical protein